MTDTIKTEEHKTGRGEAAFLGLMGGLFIGLIAGAIIQDAFEGNFNEGARAVYQQEAVIDTLSDGRTVVTRIDRE